MFYVENTVSLSSHHHIELTFICQETL